MFISYLIRNLQIRYFKGWSFFIDILSKR
jgi:hypothetical protein